MLSFSLSLVAAWVGFGSASILWDGRFNSFTSSTDLNNWSWSNEVGPYQYYIHGSETVTDYINLSPNYKNPADSGSNQGAKFTLDSTSYWNGQTMRRTGQSNSHKKCFNFLIGDSELRAVSEAKDMYSTTTAAINAGKVFYHFSIMHSSTNPPSIYREHQICFFESHFTELKSGWISGEAGTSDSLLRWDVSSSTHWSVQWTAGTWYNFAYEIDFSGGSVALWQSTGANALTLVVPAVSVSASSNGEDWHLGVLELPVSGQTDATEDFYFSGVYVESGSITTSIAGPGGAVISASGGSTPTSSAAVGTTLVSSTVGSATSAAAGTLPKYAQCGGEGWAGTGTCVSGTTCIVSNAYYSQCL